MTIKQMLLTLILIPAFIHSNTTKAQPECVLLLHGLARTSGSMENMAQYLQQQHYRTFNIDYPSRKHSIEYLSTLVFSQAQDSAQQNHCQIMHIVTHSMGGILVRDFLAKNTLPTLGKVVMLGPPNQGSELVDAFADWELFQWLNGPAGAQLGTDSLSHPNILGPIDFELGVIAGDRSINIINSMIIPGADDGKVAVLATYVKGMQDHLILHTTHPLMMNNQEVQKQVLHFLQHGSFKKEPAKCSLTD
jgi:triacylglycerol lipase